MNEQISKRFEEILRMEILVIEQLEELSWLLKDALNDLIEDSSIRARVEGNGKPTTQRDSAVGVPS
jgi:hypothetical protein